MAFENKKPSTKKEACIDDASLNLLMAVIAAILVVTIVLAAFLIILRVNSSDLGGNGGNIHASKNDTYPFKVNGINISIPSSNEAKYGIPDELISSEEAILIDVTSNEVVASRLGEQMIYPASMTKVMTLIVVYENLKNEDSINDIIEIKYGYGENSGYGFKVGERLSVKDLIYAAMLRSDGVACLELADYIAGSEANFVKLMNEKAKELGIDKTTLFQNCTGLHHKYHYSTCRDIAIMMAYAMKNPHCAKVLTSLKYNPGDNFRPDDGCVFWHSFLHERLADGATQPKTAEILGGKTGLTEKDTSGYCIVAYAKGDNGHFYISVTAKADSWISNVDDILKIYNEYAE